MGPDPFELLGIQPAFDLDLSGVQRAYLTRSARLHPDVAGDAAARQSAALNEAKRMLDDPEARANALLARLGGPPREAERTLPPRFLAEMMEVREQVEEAISSGDPGQRERWEGWSRQQREGYIGRLSEAFAAAGRSPAPEALRAIRILLNELRYIERLIEQLDPGHDAAGPA